MRLIIWVAFLTFVAAPIYGNTDSGQPAKDQHSTRNVTDAFSRFGLEGISVIYQQTSQNQPDSGKGQPKSYLQRMFTAENANQWALCVVGTVGIIVALRTLKQIRRQTDILAE